MKRKTIQLTASIISLFVGLGLLFVLPLWGILVLFLTIILASINVDGENKK